MAGLPHQRLAAACGDMIEQRAAGLHIGDNRRPGVVPEHILGVDHQQLVTPDHAALAIDRADPVAIAIESHSEIELLVRDQRLEVRQIGLDRGIGMMIGEIAIHFGVKQMMGARQARSKFLKRRAGSTIARIPADLEPGERRGVYPVQPLKQPPDILFEDVLRFGRSGAVGPSALRGNLAQPLDIRAEERAPLEHHLEAIVIGGIMAAGYLDAAVHIRS